MGSSAKKRSTMAKMTRERAVKERRERKQQKKAEKRQAAAEGADVTPAAEPGDDELVAPD